MSYMLFIDGSLRYDKTTKSIVFVLVAPNAPQPKAFLLNLSNRLGVDLAAGVLEKLQTNAFADPGGWNKGATSAHTSLPGPAEQKCPIGCISKPAPRSSDLLLRLALRHGHGRMEGDGRQKLARAPGGGRI